MMSCRHAPHELRTLNVALMRLIDMLRALVTFERCSNVGIGSVVIMSDARFEQVVMCMTS